MPAKKKSATKKKSKKATKKAASRKKTAARKKATKKSAARKKPAAKKAARKAAKKKAPAKKKKAAKKKVAAKKKAPAKKKKAAAKKKASAKKKAPARKKPAAKKAAKKKASTKVASKKARTAAAKSKPAARKKTPRRARPKPARRRPARPGNRSVLTGPLHGFNPYQPRKGEEYMSDPQLDHFRDILNAWKQELMEEVDRTVLHMKDEAANFPDPNDRATQESEFGLELRTRDRERKLLKKIESALGRIDDGSYGFCEETGEEIGLKRLEARPVATMCLEAQERRELAERQFRDREDRYR